MRQTFRLLRWLLIVVLVVVVGLGTGTVLFLRRSLPTYDGVVRVPGISAPVEIIRDTDAIPHIYAETEADAFFGLGYVHAQDRLWQMEFQRRVGQGRLSEVLGEATVPADRFLRTLGVGRAAQSAWDTLPDDTRALIDAYVAGVNAFIGGDTSLPPEFAILGIEPEPWSGPDVMVWAKMMAWDLGGNYSTELLRVELIQRVGTARMAELLPMYPDDGPVILGREQGARNTRHETRDTEWRRGDEGKEGESINSELGTGYPPGDLEPSIHMQGDYSGLIDLDEEVRSLIGSAGAAREGLGSNNWVIAGAKSTTGMPILADDPHLSTRVPSIWYLAHLSAGDYDAIGATIPGLPGIVIGRNRSIAWGVTNVEPDVQDLYRERLDLTGTQAEFQGQMEPMQIITETIKVQGRPDVQQMVRITRHGPLISDALNANDLDADPDDRARDRPLEPLAFRWTALDPGDTTVVAFLGVNRAQNWDEFREALRSYVVPSQNFVYADVVGNIGYFAPGKIPIRQSGDGMLPAEGWSGAHEWIDYIPFDQLPQAYNPPEGFIATANNRVAGDDYPYFIASDWAAPYRAQRIVDLLNAKDKHSPDDIAAIQADTVSLFARELTPKLLDLASPRTEDEQRAVDLLQAWDGDTRGDSAAAAIFEAWFAQLPRALVGDELGAKLTNRYQWRFSFLSRFVNNTLDDADNQWCDIIWTPEREDCRMIVGDALRAALDDLEARLGSDMDRWRWDQVHTVIFPHQPFDNVGALRPYFSRSIGNGGDWSTVNVGPFELDQLVNQPPQPGASPRATTVVARPGQQFEQRAGPSYRHIVDLASSDGGRFIHMLGQSGHPASPHYGDYLEDWQAVRYRSMRFDRAVVEQARMATLRLEP